MKKQARNHASPWLYGAATFLCATAAVAGQDPQTPEPQQIAYRQELPSTGMGFHHELRFPRFDSRRGVLQGVRISLETELVGSASLENVSDEMLAATNAFGAHFELRNPANGQMLAETNPMQVYRNQFAAYDGVLDFDGRSGVTYRPIILQEDVALNLSALQLSSFIGVPGDAGEIQLDVNGEQDNFGIGTPGVLALYLSNGSATVTVSYVYAPHQERADGEVIGEN
jgi:hypothetical protein